MGTEIPNRANIPLRPTTTPFFAPQNALPFSSSSPTAGVEAAAFRPSNPVPSSQTPPSFSNGPLAGPEATGFRPVQTGISNGPPGPPPPSSYRRPQGSFLRFPSPQFTSPAQVPPPRSSLAERPVVSTPVRPPAGPFSSAPGSFQTQPQPQSFPSGSPLQSIDTFQPGMNVPQSSVNSPFAAPRTNLQTASPPVSPVYPAARGTSQPVISGYPTQQSDAIPQAPPANSVAFSPQQGGYVAASPAVSRPYFSPQGGYMQSPSFATPIGMYSQDRMRNPGSMPPTGTAQSLVEDFNSLSLRSIPGTLDTGIDSKALPRPLDGDVEPKSFEEMYPMNCNSRYLRLSTCAMPNSQSLASRWHLPLGAVVCPLVETPEGEEVPVVNFVTSGINRCRWCCTYVNPYITFTDHRREWRCNICSLLNDVPG